MPGLKEIRSRIQSVNNTKQVTYAMKLVSAAKLRKSQESVVRSREYTQALMSLLQRLVRASGKDSFSHPLMETRKTVKKVRLIVIGANRGLCGGYNTNLNKLVESFVKERPGVEIESILLGRKPAEYYRRVRRSYDQAFEQLPDDAVKWPLEDLVTTLEHDYEKGIVDEAYVIYTKFRSAMSMKPTIEKILPLSIDSSGEGEEVEADGTTLFEPSVEAVFQAVLPRVLRSQILQAALDSKASEHGARMVAMDGATKNAGDLAKRLQRRMNKLRQEGITAQLLDIIGGAAGASA